MAGGGVGVEGHHFTFGCTAAPDNFTQGLRNWSDALVSGEQLQTIQIPPSNWWKVLKCFIITIIWMLLSQCATEL